MERDREEEKPAPSVKPPSLLGESGLSRVCALGRARFRPEVPALNLAYLSFKLT